MAHIITEAERPKVDEKPSDGRDLSGRYRVVHGDLLVPLEGEYLTKAVAKGLAPFTSLFVGSVVELTHKEADQLLDHGVIEPEIAPRKGQTALAKAKSRTA